MPIKYMLSALYPKKRKRDELHLDGTGICSHSEQLTFLTCILRMFFSPLPPDKLLHKHQKMNTKRERETKFFACLKIFKIPQKRIMLTVYAVS